MQNNLAEIKEKIIKILKIRGPSLPVHIARETGLDVLFASALLAELASEKEIRISKMKVGGSPLYFLQGQEMQLERFINYLPGKEREAFLLLKQKKVLEDSRQEPPIRVALRNLKDFAFPFVTKIKEKGELFWRFHSVGEQEAKEKLKSVTEIKKIRTKKPEKKETEKPLIELKPKKDRFKEKSGFVKSVVDLLTQENIEILEEKEIKKREYIAIIRINSGIGKLTFLLIAKDKKRVTENDFTIALQKSQASKMPCLFLSPGEPSKKALNYIGQYSGLLKFKKLSRVQ